MAKNFGQYDEENPVMAILGKAKLEEEKKSGETETEDADSKDSSAVAKKDDSSDIRKILLNISIRESTKKEWKMFFLEHDLTMTQGIETAVEYLRAEAEKGNIRLSKGGVTK